MLLLVLLIAGNVRRDIKVTLAGLIFGACGYLLNASPLTGPESPIDPWVDLVSISTPFWLWLFARRLFEIEPPRIWIIGIVTAYLAAWFSGNFLVWTRPVGFYTIHVLSLVLIADLVRVAFQGREDDLLEKRRVIRLWLPLLIAAQACGILIFELIFGAAVQVPAVQLVNGLLILLLVLFAGLALMKTDEQLLLETITTAPEPENTDALTPQEKVLSDKLLSSMGEGYYRTPGLTIASLAEHLGTPEHRLRSLINRRMGHRNFSSFLNRHRIGEAKKILGDPEQVNLPVLTIAMDLGYNSLPTFNRAFRSEASVTPTDFRRKAIGQN
ncbi:MAG: AraC family transcriptional regulator [Erythrobacter sp.]